MSDHLPPEIIVEILLKLPVKSLIRFTTICKSWHDTITRPSFISSHHHKVPKNKTLLLQRRDIHNNKKHFSLLGIADDKNGDFCCITSSSELSSDLHFQSHYARIGIVGCCRGIVCLCDTYFSPILWNPSARKYLILPKASLNPTWKDIRALGCGSADNDDFKVVELVYAGDSSSNGVGYSPPEAEVFSLKTGRWRRLNGIRVKLRVFVMATSYQVFLNGVVHWIGYRYHKRGNAQGRCGVLAFRVGEKVFDEIFLPYELANALVSDLRVASAGESLAVLKYHGDSRQGTRCCDIWLMKEYGVESSWTKCYKVSLVEGMKKILALRNNGEALGEASSEIGLIALDLASGKTRNLGIHGRTNSFYVDNYVESLELLKCESQDLKEAEGVEEILIRIENALLEHQLNLS